MKIMAGREEVLKIFPRDLRAVLGQVTVDFDRVQEIRMRTRSRCCLSAAAGNMRLKQMEAWRWGFPIRR